MLTVYARHGSYLTVLMLNHIKNLGFKYATIFGATIGVNDIIIPEKKPEMIEKANKDVMSIQNQYVQGHITNEERYNRVVEVWSQTNEELTNEMMEKLLSDRQGFNPVYMMANSGARGSRSQIRQLAGMRGLMAKPGGDIIELPIRSNFQRRACQLLNFSFPPMVHERDLPIPPSRLPMQAILPAALWILPRTWLSMRRIAAQSMELATRRLRTSEEIVETLAERITGRFVIEGVKHPISGEMIVDVNEEIREETAAAIEEAGIESVRIRTVLTCESKYGVCRKCYGQKPGH